MASLHTLSWALEMKAETFWADLFKDTPVQVHITTDDGSVGTKGFPTAIMPELINSNTFTSVMTCASPMMKVCGSSG